jgi:two-component system, NarL family, sensor kinase
MTDIIINSLILLGLFAILFILFLIADHKNKKILAQKQEEIREQLISELKKDHQIQAARAVLQGEEQERARISRDIHDGLGGLLSGLKLSLSGILDGHKLPIELNEKFNKAIGELNNSITELRRISHNLMPPAIVQFGLKEALNDFCVQLNNKSGYRLIFIFYGSSFRFNSSIEIATYRIAQEAINNALKYSEATEIKVQLILEPEWVNLTVQDNGKGFDFKKNEIPQSSGLRNMRARAESFDGRLDISSKEGVGTEIIVDFILNAENSLN